MNLHRHRIGIVPVMIIVAAASALFAADRLDVAQSVRMAAQHSPELRAASQQHREAVYNRKAAFGAYLPLISLEGGLMGVWQSDTQMGISAGSFSTAPMIPEKDISFMSKVDHQYSIGATAAQPLSYLYTIYLSNRIAGRAAEVLKLNVTLTHRAVGLLTATTYYNVHLAQSGVRIAEQALSTLESHVKDAAFYLEQGLITRSELLKIEVQAQKTRQGLDEARQGMELARSALARYLGVSPDRIELVEESDDAALPESPCTLKECIAAGMRDRPELQMARGQAVISADAAEASKMGLIPNILATASYKYSEDGSKSTADHSVAGGLVLQWNVWDWGQVWYKAKAQKAASRASAEAVTQAERDVSLQIEQAWRNLIIEGQRIESAKVLLSQTEENYRIEKELFAVQKGTATTLMDAETGWVQAQSELAMARFRYRIAYAALRMAIGKFPIEGNFPLEP